MGHLMAGFIHSLHAGSRRVVREIHAITECTGCLAAGW